MHELEWQTRKERIDARLKAAIPAWKIIPYHDGLDLTTLDRCAVTEFPTDNGPADYALFVNGRWLGIIEAKKVGVGPQNVLEQARRYAREATHGVGNWNGARVPFLYATNGEVFWYSDERLPDKYDRYLADVFLEGDFSPPSALDSQPREAPIFLNNALLENGHAVRMDGSAPKEWELTST